MSSVAEFIFTGAAFHGGSENRIIFCLARRTCALSEIETGPNRSLSMLTFFAFHSVVRVISVVGSASPSQARGRGFNPR